MAYRRPERSCKRTFSNESRVELYSERAEYNILIQEIKAEILKREKNEC